MPWMRSSTSTSDGIKDADTFLTACREDSRELEPAGGACILVGKRDLMLMHCRGTFCDQQGVCSRSLSGQAEQRRRGWGKPRSSRVGPEPGVRGRVRSQFPRRPSLQLHGIRAAGMVRGRAAIARRGCGTRRGAGETAQRNTRIQVPNPSSCSDSSLGR
eukprot:2463754-Rhodomonas_salina.1